MAGVISFMDSPLVTWVRTFGDVKDPPDFTELCDGVFLNDVMAQIDHRDTEIDADIRRSAKDTNAKLQNWSILIKNILSYYQDVLQQLVVMETPDIVSIVKEPTKESSLSSLKKVLLLLLGCAVQCDHKEDYINVIKTLDVGIQQAMVSSIQQITDACDNVLDIDGIVGEKELICIIRNVVEERNSLAQSLLPLTQERDFYRHELTDKRGASLTPPVHLEKYQLYRDATDWKHKCNALLEDVEDKSKLISDLQEELHEVNEQLARIKSENVSLSRDARTVQSYRDELDSLREKALRVERCERDLVRCRERLAELDFYKGRVEELRKDNDAVSESRTLAEEQLATCQKKSESVMEELLRTRVHLEEANRERESLRQRLRELTEENAMLEFDKSERYGGNGIRRFTSTTSIDIAAALPPGHSISDELQESLSSQMMRLELERDEMKQELDDAKERLYEAQVMLKKVQDETEQDIKRKVADLESQSRRQRSQTSKQLSAEYKQKMEEVEQCRADLTKKFSAEYKAKVTQLEAERQQLKVSHGELEARLEFIQRDLRKTQEQCDKLASVNCDLGRQKEQDKVQIQMIQESSNQRIHELEDELAGLRSRPEPKARICASCNREIKNANNTSYDRIDPDAGVRRPSRHLDTPDGSPLVRSTSLRQSPRPSLVSQSVQTSPSPAWISYCADGMNLPPDAKYNDENKQRKGSSSSKSKILDILRPKSASSSRHGSPLPTRPSTVLGVVHENRSASLSHQGTSTPQRRSVPNTPPDSPFKEPPPFRRNDRLRSTIHHGGSSTHRPSTNHHPHANHSADYIPFSRDDRLRSTMPERRSGYVAPERRRHLASSGSRSSISSIDSNMSRGGDRDETSELDNSILAYLDWALCPTEISRECMYNSDRDSGCPTSPDTPTSNGGPSTPSRSTPSRSGHQLTSFEVVSSETIRTQIRTTLGPKGCEKWQALVNKILDLQDRNNKLQGSNSQLRKNLNSAKFSEDRIGVLEKRNLQLEVENRKLNKIVESLQSTLDGTNPYDKRTYHFYSNV